MARTTLALIIFAGLAGCIGTKDVGLEGGGDTSSSGGREDPGTTSSDPPPPTGGDGTSESGTGGAGETGSSTSGGDGSSSGADPSTSSSGGSEETEGFGDDQDLCEFSGGVWDEGSCGHYVCGAPPDCGAVVPGCDCGPFENFLPKLGCFPRPECAIEFSCGEQNCTAPDQLCDVFVPGVKGEPTTYTCESTPDACVEEYSCSCIAPEGSGCEQADDGTITITTYGA